MSASPPPPAGPTAGRGTSSPAIFGTLLRDRAERLQAARSGLRVATFGLTAVFIVLEARGPEVLLILLPEIAAFVLFFRVRALHVASRRVRTAYLVEDSLGRPVDTDLKVDLGNDLPNVDDPPKVEANRPYYSSVEPPSISRLLENVHESAFYWAALLREQRRTSVIWFAAGSSCIVIALSAIYFPATAPTLLSAAALVVAVFFVSEQVNEIADSIVFHREFSRLEKELAATRRLQRIPLATVIWLVARYDGLAHGSPLVPGKNFVRLSPLIARRWSERNQPCALVLEP